MSLADYRAHDMVLRLFALVVPLALDTFAVSAAMGLTGLTGLSAGRRVRLSALFGLFEGGMPAVGLLLGAPLGHAIGGAADYLAIAILVGFGAYVLIRRENGEDESARRLATARGRAALLLGLSVSLDELALGFTLGLLRLPVAPVLLLIAGQAVLASQLGFVLGARVPGRWQESAERLAGLALLALGGGFLAARLLG